jgi:hypothetical protein
MGDPKIGAGLVGVAMEEDTAISEYVALDAESDTCPTGGVGRMGVVVVVLGTDVALTVLDVIVGAGTFGSMLSPLTTFLARLAPARGNNEPLEGYLICIFLCCYIRVPA